MTTWAYDGVTIAVDSRESSNGDIISDRKKKLFVGKNYVFTGAAKTVSLYQIVDWLTSGAILSEMPKVKSFDGFLFLQGKFFRLEGPTLIPLDKETYSGGSGWMWAKSAMDLGCTAIEAVKFAAKHNGFTGGPVQSYTFKDKVKK